MTDDVDMEKRVEMVEVFSAAFEQNLLGAIAGGVPFEVISDAMISAWLTICRNTGNSHLIEKVAQAIVNDARRGCFDLPPEAVQ